jgi:alkylation response protein AidB-like acyl-CoA dehydrogenase
MDLDFTPEQQAFRREVRDFVASHLPGDIAHAMDRIGRVDQEQTRRWYAILADKGWTVPGWPVEHGGPGWGPTEKFIFEEEMALGGAPMLPPFGARMVGPVILTFGNARQQEKYLPRIRSGADLWCQGYSEPGAGSDLASLRTRAVRDGDVYVVNGQKTWTSYAHWAERMFCLVRTGEGARKQEGISFLLLDMDMPGITVRPIITLDGAHIVNEVFFEDVRVPVANLVGEEGKGWTYAKFLLGHERAGIAKVGHSKRALARLKAFARKPVAGGRPLLDDPVFRHRLARATLALKALEMTNFRLLADEGAGRDVGPAASILKIRGAELTQTLSELAVFAAGYGALAMVAPIADGANETPLFDDFAAAAMPGFLNNRAATIFGGSNEIQRNVLAKTVLGL